ncbi:hypothetical protein Bbelb_363230 [Branchiostoma belcheri]|nr:hypothetical protein Bbelb_363230 [Branchiostoma belcheri]
MERSRLPGMMPDCCQGLGTYTGQHLSSRPDMPPKKFYHRPRRKAVQNLDLCQKHTMGYAGTRRDYSTCNEVIIAAVSVAGILSRMGVESFVPNSSPRHVQIQDVRLCKSRQHVQRS